MWYFYMIECIQMQHKRHLGEKVIYTGETSRDSEVRFDEHVHHYHSEWMRRNGWRPRRLLYVECMPDCEDHYTALLREKQLKGDRGLKKALLIEARQMHACPEAVAQ